MDSGEIRLNELNLLIGQNSSGKSSFLRLFPMMKESARNELMGPILWFDDNYDFGGFQTALSRHRTSDEIGFSFSWRFEEYKIDDVLGDFIFWGQHTLAKGTNCRLSFSIAKNSDRVHLSRFRFSVGEGLTISCESIKYDSDVIIKLNDRIVNGEVKCRWNYGTKSLLPVLSVSENIFSVQSLAKELLNITDEKKRGIYVSFYENERLYRDDEDIEKYLHSVASYHGVNLSLVDINKESEKYRKLSSYLYLITTKALSEYANRYISTFFTHSYYITPLRYNLSRYMRNRELAIDYIESTGKNVLEYILSLKKKDLESYSAFIKETLGIQVSVIGDDNKSIEVLNSEGEKDNIVDIGYGFSQVLPIATTLWDRAYKKDESGILETVVIEQPEVHLHPAMQAGLAKLFISAIQLAKKRGKKLCLIVETHSSRLVNRVGRCIYNSSIGLGKSEDELQFPRSSASLFLFEKKGGITKISQTEYDNNGRIINWPMGFLD